MECKYRELWKEKLSLQKAQTLEKDTISCKDLLREDRFHKIFFYEIRPVIRISEYLSLSIDDIYLKFCGDTQEYDAEIISNNHIDRVECTRAITPSWGNTEHHQIEHLKKYHHAPVHQKILFDNKEMRETFTTEVFTSDELIKRVEDMIVQGFKRKRSEEKRKDYLLAITFVYDDIIEDIKKLYLSNSIQKMARDDFFKQIFIIEPRSYLWDSLRPDKYFSFESGKQLPLKA